MSVGNPFALPNKVVHASAIEVRALKDILRYGMPDIMLQFGGGIGDELLLTAVARELKKRKPSLKIWQVSHSADLLLGNHYYDRVFTMEHWPLRYSALLSARRCRLAYATEKVTRKEEIPPDIHIIAELCRKAGICGEVAIRPYIFLTEAERKAGRCAQRQIAIQCIGDNSYVTVMRNKLWYTDRFQEVLDTIRMKEGSGLRILQVGKGEDTLLRGVTDLRGRTSLRETAAVLSQSECFIGTVGFLMHLARAVECRSVIIYGGREHSIQTGYICNENLNSFVECAPCWKWNDCERDRECMKAIQARDVINAFERLSDRRNVPLETESMVLGAASS
jgi:ADP-heptose:LPS heptosyltransferase